MTDENTQQRKRARWGEPSRRLWVPETQEDWDSLRNGHVRDAYQEQPIIFGRLRRPRPLPSTQILASTMSGSATAMATTTASNSRNPVSTLKIPLIQDFFKSLGVDLTTPSNSNNNDQEQQADATAGVLEDLDNPSFSQLSVGQHARYLQLSNSQQTDKRTLAERKEFKALHQHVKSEQYAYRQALERFLDQRKDRFLTGFRRPSSGLAATAQLCCQWASSHQKWLNQNRIQACPIPTQYGKCLQFLSLQPLSKKSSSSSWDINAQSLNVTSISPSDTQSFGIAVTVTTADLPAVGSHVSAPTKNTPFQALMHDEEIHRLLAEHDDIDIVTTDTTLETLMLLPGQYHSRWMLYVDTITTTTKHNTAKKIKILDIPIQQTFLSPRDCLTKGLEEGLYQQVLEKSNGNNDNDKQDKKQGRQFVYTRWTLPSSLLGNAATSTQRRRRQPTIVLIRSSVRLTTTPSHNTDMSIPFRIRCHVEYFPERGREVPSTYERALWIFDQFLFHNEKTNHANVETKFCRIDATTCQIMAWEDTSIAHALADNEEDAMVHFLPVVQFLHGISIIVDKEERFLLCLPGIPGDKNHSAPSSLQSVSVHAPILNNPNNNSILDDTVVDIEPVLENADGVVMGDTALINCRRPWKWDIQDRVPYTFPVSESAKKK